MMDTVWRCIEKVPYNFSRSSIKFQVHMGHKSDDLSKITTGFHLFHSRSKKSG